MFAIIRTGGKQYKVGKDDVIRVEKLAGKEGDSINLDDIVMVSDGKKSHKIGAENAGKAQVKAEIVAQERDDKITVFKKKRRQGYRRKKGHRQDRTVLKITDVKAA